MFLGASAIERRRESVPAVWAILASAEVSEMSGLGADSGLWGRGGLEIVTERADKLTSTQGQHWR